MPLIIAAMSELPREQFLPEVPARHRLCRRGHSARRRPVPDRAAGHRAAAAGSGDRCRRRDARCRLRRRLTSAIMARLASAVVALESDPGLATRATQALDADWGRRPRPWPSGRCRDGCPSQAPYDVIVFSGAVAAVPKALCEQLAEGGRMVAVIEGDKGIGRGTLFLRRGGSVSRRPLFDSAIPLLPEFASAADLPLLKPRSRLQGWRRANRGSAPCGFESGCAHRGARDHRLAAPAAQAQTLAGGAGRRLRDQSHPERRAGATARDRRAVPQALSGLAADRSAPLPRPGGRWLDSNQESLVGARTMRCSTRSYGASIEQPLYRGGQTVGADPQRREYRACRSGRG